MRQPEKPEKKMLVFYIYLSIVETYRIYII